jgi:hypothetical protein
MAEENSKVEKLISPETIPAKSEVVKVKRKYTKRADKKKDVTKKRKYVFKHPKVMFFSLVEKSSFAATQKATWTSCVLEYVRRCLGRRKENTIVPNNHSSALSLAEEIRSYCLPFLL